MRYLLIILPFIPFLFGCNDGGLKQREAKKQDSIRYENLILNIALTYPEFRGEYYDYIKNGFQDIKEIMSTKYMREVKDAQLGITLRLHTWDGNWSPNIHPYKIVYISDYKTFEYAFPIDDWAYYEKAKAGNKYIDEESLRNRMNFGEQLDFIAHGLKIDNPSHKKEFYHLIKLIEDSLLGNKEFQLSDTTKYRELIKSECSGLPDKCKPCFDSVSNCLNKIIADILDNGHSVSYFMSKIDKKYAFSENAFWRFNFTARIHDTTLRVNTYLIWRECYDRVYF